MVCTSAYKNACTYSRTIGDVVIFNFSVVQNIPPDYVPYM
nr:MAG TPA: hypothetical protein [Caudoviricetes sp.]